MGILRRFRGYFGAQRIRGNYSASQGYVETNADANVAMLLKFDEPSGDISGSGITLTANGGPVYNIAATGLFAGISPGIDFDGSASFRKDTATPALNLGVNVSFVWEFYFSTTSTTAGVVISTNAVGGTEPGWYLYAAGGGNKFSVLLNADDGTNWNATFTGASYSDGSIHKVRVVGDRSGAGTNVEVLVDGVSYGTANPTTNGKLISASKVYVGDYSASPGAGNRYHGTLYTGRIVIGNSTANLGGPGGG